MGKVVVAAVLAASSFVAVAGMAQTPQAMPERGGRGGMGLMRADANGDGVVTRDEATAQADRQFDAMDANHDGKVTGEEMRAAFQGAGGGRGMGGGRFGGGGGGGGAMADMSMSRDDFRARALARFDRADANHDGKVDQAEMEAMRQMRMAGRAAEAPAPAPAPAPQQ